MASPISPPFEMHGPAMPLRPVILSVPHAGRVYPADILAMARVDAAVLRRLEDRHADALASQALAQGCSTIIATVPRAVIDLNRAEDEWDSSMIGDRIAPGVPNRRVRQGLGLVPWRLHPDGPLWRGRLSGAELDRRIASIHRPYHAAISAALIAAKARFGRAVLIDLHSMPTQPQQTPQIIVGDRHGSTAPAELADRLLAVAEGADYTIARNAPYAGAHSVATHAAPNRGIVAVQIEVDRALYLNADGMTPDLVGVRTVAAMIARMVDAAEEWATGGIITAIAAE
jgi:N-formylglutamate amidohydrolase